MHYLKITIKSILSSLIAIKIKLDKFTIYYRSYIIFGKSHDYSFRY